MENLLPYVPIVLFQIYFHDFFRVLVWLRPKRLSPEAWAEAKRLKKALLATLATRTKFKTPTL